MSLIGWLRRLALLIGLAAALWLFGFAFYLADVAEHSGSPALPLWPQAREQAQDTAIVVLTGGSERIATGLRLLQDGYGRKLFISGVGPGGDYAKLFAGLTRQPQLEQCCVVLGHKAGDTIGNASETALWLAQEKFSQVILVTAHYHMQRSLLEFRLLEGHLVIHPFPVAPARVQIADWWQRPRTALLLMTEYSKLLVTLLRSGLHSLS